MAETYPADVTGFIDSEGVSFVLDPEHRNRVVSRWPGIFKCQQPETDAARNAFAREQVREMVGAVGSLSGLNVLEVGCYDGSCAFAMVEAGAARVDAIDSARICLRFKAGPVGLGRNPTDRNLADEVDFLDRLRNTTARWFRVPFDRVSFFDQDVCAMDFRNDYDLVVGWQTLEHLVDLRLAFERMHAALKPGGCCYHVYNPFFGLDGGHSLCTLDFPWGHILLSESDFERYVRTFRPEAADLTLDFYRSGLNKFSILGTAEAARRAGFAGVSVQTKRCMGSPDGRTLELARRNYPDLAAEDLQSATVELRGAKGTP